MSHFRNLKKLLTHATRMEDEACRRPLRVIGIAFNLPEFEVNHKTR